MGIFLTLTYIWQYNILVIINEIIPYDTHCKRHSIKSHCSWFPRKCSRGPEISGGKSWSRNSRKRSHIGASYEVWPNRHGCKNRIFGLRVLDCGKKRIRHLYRRAIWWSLPNFSGNHTRTVAEAGSLHNRGSNSNYGKDTGKNNCPGKYTHQKRSGRQRAGTCTGSLNILL